MSGIFARSARLCIAIAAFGLSTPLLAQGGPVSVAGFPNGPLRIIVPASAGGGFDGTARAIQDVLREEKITTQPVEVINITGGGGTIGLSRLVNQHKGDGSYVLVMGLSLVGGMHAAKSPISLTSLTALARVTTDYQAAAVANNSRFKTLKELLDEVKKAPKSVVWGGGPIGGPDHLFIGYIAKSLGVSAREIPYVAFSGGDLRPQIMGGHVAAGVTSFSELKADAEGKQLRVLGIASPARLPGTNVPTAKESGYDLQFANWRGVVGPPGMKDNERDAWVQMLTRVRNSERWKNILKTRDWNDAFLAGDEYRDYLKGENDRVAALVQELGFVK
jgi:putative tricarboxylic transport membrane protein